VCDVTLRNVPAFDVSHGSRLSELWPLPCDVICLFTYHKRRVLCPKMRYITQIRVDDECERYLDGI